MPSPLHRPPSGVDRSLSIGRVSLHGLRARFVRGVGWNLVATFFTQGSTLALNLVLANLWGLKAFGQFAIIQSTITVLTSGAQAIVATTATRYAAELRARDPGRAGRVLGLCAGLAAALAAVASLGLLLGAPLVTIAKVVFDRVESLKPAGELLGR